MPDISQYQDNKDHTKHIEGDAESVEDPNRDQYEPAFIRKTVAKLDFTLLPILTLMYLCSSLDKSNLGNAKTLGMIKDIGGDKTGDKYALLNALYYVSYAPFMVPLALLGKRTRMAKLLAICALCWGIAATCFAAVRNFSGAYACRFIIGLGEAGFVPLIQVYLSRFYTRRQLGTRVGIWLAMAPMGGFFNGIIAYGVSFINSRHLESWRILFLIEGGATFLIAVIAFIMLPEDIVRCRWLSQRQKDYLIYERSLSMAPESNGVNWKHVMGTFIRWQQIVPVFINMCQQITGALFSAFLPTFLSENGFQGANAQIATLAPYGSAAVCMIIASIISDRYRNRGWPTQFGWWLSIVAFGIYLGAPYTNRSARIAALVLGETGHYIATPLIVTWTANNAGSESRRAVAVPLAVSCAQAVAVGSGYLFPARDKPVYKMGSAVVLGLSIAGSLFTFLYQGLIWRENRKRDKAEGGPPAPDFIAETNVHADDAPGFRYMP
ncbi:high-affinity nicotinic acid transporter [Cryptococcus gattii Ru294]|nr:high-affinity nicotinic acid transporter [Cryptococcus gattii Ru294]